jgi:AcrR family transcriptional regulator
MAPQRNSPSRRKAEPRRQHPQRTAKTKMAILQAGADVFGRVGYAGTRVEDILAAAHVSRPTFYRFFANKDEVFLTLNEMAALNLVQLLRSSLQSNTGALEKVAAGIEAFFRWLAATGPLASVMMLEGNRPGSLLAPARENTDRMLLEILSGEIRQIRGYDPDPVMITGLLGAMEVIGHQLLRQTPHLTEKHIERGKRIALRIFLGALHDGIASLPPVPLASRPLAKL